MELKLVKEHYISKTSASEAVFFVLKDFVVEQQFFDEDFVFEQHLKDYIKNDFKTQMTFNINHEGYMKLKGHFITYEKITQVLYRVLILKEPDE